MSRWAVPLWGHRVKLLSAKSSSLLRPQLGLKLLGGTCRGEAEHAAPLRDLLGVRDFVE